MGLKETIPLYPCKEASWMAHSSFRFVNHKSPLNSRKIFKQSKWPFEAAQCAGLRLFKSVSEGLAPLCERKTN